jgi:hypothetical protein
MLSKTLLIFAVLCTAILIGCSKTDENSNSTAANSNKTTAASTPATTAPAGDKIGIPECDGYIAKYEACAGKVPEAGRAAYKSGLDQTRATWKKLAANPQTRGSLAAACKQAAEAQAAAWKTYGCTN